MNIAAEEDQSDLEKGLSELGFENVDDFCQLQAEIMDQSKFFEDLAEDETTESPVPI